MKLDISQAQIRPMKAAEAEALAPLTYPAYRHLLSLEPDDLLQGRDENRKVHPYALVAVLGNRPIGLVLLGLPDQGPSLDITFYNTPEILSLSVVPAARRHGIGRRLISEIERYLEMGGWPIVKSHYSMDPIEGHPVDRVFDQQDWNVPSIYSVIFRSEVSTIIDLPVCRRMARLAKPKDIQAIPWNEVTPADLHALERWNESERWLPPYVGPELHHPEPLDYQVSKGLMHDGRLVGWILGHRMSNETFRLTYSFIYPRLSKMAKVLPFWIDSLHDCADLGYKNWWWTVSPVQTDMYRFSCKHLIPNLPGQVTKNMRREKRLCSQEIPDSLLKSETAA